MHPDKNILLLLSSLPLGQVSITSLVSEVALMYFIYRFRIYRIYQPNIWSIPTAEITFIWHCSMSISLVSGCWKAVESHLYRVLHKLQVVSAIFMLLLGLMRCKFWHGILSSTPYIQSPYRVTADVQVLGKFDFTVSVFDVSGVAWHLVHFPFWSPYVSTALSTPSFPFLHTLNLDFWRELENLFSICPCLHHHD